MPQFTHRICEWQSFGKPLNSNFEQHLIMQRKCGSTYGQEAPYMTGWHICINLVLTWAKMFSSMSRCTSFCSGICFEKNTQKKRLLNEKAHQVTGLGFPERHHCWVFTSRKGGRKSHADRSLFPCNWNTWPSHYIQQDKVKIFYMAGLHLVKACKWCDEVFESLNVMLHRAILSSSPRCWNIPESVCD